MASIFPPLRSLRDQRDELLTRVGELEAVLSSTSVLSKEVQVLNERLQNVESRRAQGHLVEFDYPYKPKVREWHKGDDNLWHKLLSSGVGRYENLLNSFLAYAPSLETISNDEPSDQREPYWSNPWFPVLDAISLFGLLAHVNPRRYVEVGSGNSTKFARRAITDCKLRTRIVSIDPAPRSVVDELCDEVVRQPLEGCDLRIFEDLGAEDILFLDNSHRSFQNSDVTVFFTEIIPRLRSRCHYGLHDIFLPNDYPREWIDRYYNEQYLLMAYLLGGGGGDEIVLPVHFIQLDRALSTILDPITRDPAARGTVPVGGSFWLRRA